LDKWAEIFFEIKFRWSKDFTIISYCL